MPIYHYAQYEQTAIKRMARQHATCVDEVDQLLRAGIFIESSERIAALYAVEKEIRGHPASGRREVRETRSRPLLDSLKQWLEETLGKLSRKSDTAMLV